MIKLLFLFTSTLSVIIQDVGTGGYIRADDKTISITKSLLLAAKIDIELVEKSKNDILFKIRGNKPSAQYLSFLDGDSRLTASHNTGNGNQVFRLSLNSSQNYDIITHDSKFLYVKPEYILHRGNKPANFHGFRLLDDDVVPKKHKTGNNKKIVSGKVQVMNNGALLLMDDKNSHVSVLSKPEDKTKLVCKIVKKNKEQPTPVKIDEIDKEKIEQERKEMEKVEEEKKKKAQEKLEELKKNKDKENQEKIKKDKEDQEKKKREKEEAFKFFKDLLLNKDDEKAKMKKSEPEVKLALKDKEPNLQKQSSDVTTKDPYTIKKIKVVPDTEEPVIKNFSFGKLDTPKKSSDPPIKSPLDLNSIDIPEKSLEEQKSRLKFLINSLESILKSLISIFPDELEGKPELPESKQLIKSQAVLKPKLSYFPDPETPISLEPKPLESILDKTEDRISSLNKALESILLPFKTNPVKHPDEPNNILLSRSRSLKNLLNEADKLQNDKISADLELKTKKPFYFTKKPSEDVLEKEEKLANKLIDYGYRINR